MIKSTRRITVISSFFIALLAAGFVLMGLSTPIHATNPGEIDPNTGYGLTLTPPPDSKTIAGDPQYDYTTNNVSHPKISILPISSVATAYGRYDLFVKGALKTSWTNINAGSTYPFTAYTWDLCAGNEDYTNETITVNFSYEGSTIGDGINPNGSVLASQSFFVTKYNCDAQPGTGDKPSASDLTPTLTTATKTAVVVSVDSGLAKYINPTGTGKLNWYVDGTYKGLLTFTNGQVWNTWDTSGTAVGDHQLWVDYQAADGSVVHGTPITTTKNADGGFSTNPPSTTGTNPGDSGGTISMISFTVPKISWLDDCGNTSGNTTTPQTPCSGIDLLKNVFVLLTDYMLIGISILAFVAMIVAGITYATSFGDPAKAERGRKSILWAVYGIAIITFSLTVIKILGGIIAHGVQ